jgi:hypothetical protein
MMKTVFLEIFPENLISDEKLLIETRLVSPNRRVKDNLIKA